MYVHISHFVKDAQEKEKVQKFIFSEMIKFEPINHSTVSEPIEIEHIIEVES